MRKKCLYVLILTVCMLLLPVFQLKAQASVSEVSPLIISRISEAGPLTGDEKALLYSKEYMNTPTIYAFSVSERGWFGLSSFHSYAVYNDEALENIIIDPDHDNYSYPSAGYYERGDGYENNYCLIYLEPGTYYIKDTSGSVNMYAFFLPDSKVLSHDLVKSKDGSSYTDTISFVPEGGVTYLIPEKVDITELNGSIWQSDKVSTNIFDKYTITENGDYTVKAEFSDQKWSIIKIMYSFSVSDLGKHSEDKDQKKTDNNDKTESKDDSGVSESKAGLNYTSVEIKVGQSLKLKVTGTTQVSFKSSKKSVAKVKSSGKVVGKKKGTATIKVTCENGETYTCKVKVVKK